MKNTEQPINEHQPILNHGAPAGEGRERSRTDFGIAQNFELTLARFPAFRACGEGPQSPAGESTMPASVALWHLAVWFCLLLLPQVASAQSYSIGWYKISGGGGMNSTGGTYFVTGTIGQHDAGSPMTGGSYSVTGGFWSLLAPVQTPGAPLLYIARYPSSVTIFWQAVAGWTLQQNSDVTASASWIASTGVTNSSGTNYLTLTAPAGRWFFRLMNP